MKKDGEIKLLLDERSKGTKQKLAAARAGVSERTARKYEQAGKLPSQMKRTRTHRTRDDPFVGDWPWVEAQIRDDPALQTKTLFALLCATFPGRYQEGQLRTLQRHVQAWGGCPPAREGGKVSPPPPPRTPGRAHLPQKKTPPARPSRPPPPQPRLYSVVSHPQFSGAARVLF